MSTPWAAILWSRGLIRTSRGSTPLSSTLATPGTLWSRLTVRFSPASHSFPGSVG